MPRWGYPPKDGIPEGNSCWYCSTTVRLLYVGKSIRDVKELIDGDAGGAQMKLFFQRRNKIIECSIENGGQVSKGSVTDVVDFTETTAFRHKQRGRAMSVRKYKQKIGKDPEPDQIFDRKGKQYVKIYNHSDSSSWSFEESDAEVSSKRTIVDDGSMAIEEDQGARHHGRLRELVFGGGKSTPPSKRLLAAEVKADEAEHTLSPEDKRLREAARAAGAQQPARPIEQRASDRHDRDAKPFLDLACGLDTSDAAEPSHGRVSSSGSGRKIVPKGKAKSAKSKTKAASGKAR